MKIAPFILIIFLLISCEKTTMTDKITESNESEKSVLTYKPNNANYSGHQLKIIPLNPEFEPTKEQQIEGITFLANSYAENEINSTVNKHVEFVDQGQNFESVSCDKCGKKLDIEIWQELMSSAFENRFQDLTFESTCCHKTTSLNTLIYDAPAGFSKYELTITNPEYDENLEDKLLTQLNEIFNTEMRLIWANY